MKDIDRLSHPNPIEKALEDVLEVFGQIPITVTACGPTADGVLKGNLTGEILQFVTPKESLMPYPGSEVMHKLQTMVVKDEGVHHLITDLVIDDDEFSFLIGDISVIVHLIERGKYPKVDDADIKLYRFDYVRVPNVPKRSYA
jgi:hypothetical protein